LIMSNEPRIVFGMKDGEFVHIDSLSLTGKDCGCVCPVCGTPLIAKHKRKRNTNHFAHASGTERAECYETVLHQMAKKILSEINYIVLPGLNIKLSSTKYARKFVFIRDYPPDGKFKISDVRIEKKIEDVIPDIVVMGIDGSKIMIEICVTHAVDETKLNKIVKMELPAIEIDLSDFNLTPDSYAVLKKILIDETNKKMWLFPTSANGQPLNRFIQYVKFDSINECISKCPRKEEISKDFYVELIPCNYCEHKLKPVGISPKPLKNNEAYCIGNYGMVDFLNPEHDSCKMDIR